MSLSVFAVSSIQICGDFICMVLASYLFVSKRTENKVFYLLNAVSFLLLTLGDFYYNYHFRIKAASISESITSFVVVPMLVFQLAQCYNWGMILKKKRTKLFSFLNFPYILAVSIIVIDLVYFFLTSNRNTLQTEFYQSISIILDMLVWLFAIICLARTKSLNVTLLSTGTLLIISADLTARTIFIFAMKHTAETSWIHIVWALGVVLMLFGFIASIKSRYFEFCLPRSLQVVSTSYMLVISFVGFIVGIVYLVFLTIADNNLDAHVTLWNLPIALVFTMILTILIARLFTGKMVSPLQNNLKNIAAFNSGHFIEQDNAATNVDEFLKLEEFINKSFRKISAKLVKEKDLSAQVAHDIRSPLTSLDLLINKSSDLEETKRIILRNAINDIRDIVDNLEAGETDKYTEVQLIPLIESVLSSYRETTLKTVNVVDNFAECDYSSFALINLSQFKRIFFNLLNNAKEAISLEDGVIEIKVKNAGKKIIITVEDNGIGVYKDDIDSIFKKGFTTKENGAGIGLFHAKSVIKSWGGDIYIESTPGQKTCLSIVIPLITPPVWFLSEINILSCSTVVCVDDSSSIQSVWMDKLHEKNVALKYFENREKLLRVIDDYVSTSTVYFVDYEFSGKTYSGIDIIKDIKLHSSAAEIYLVTSRFYEEPIQSYCVAHGIPLISKEYLARIGINILMEKLN